MGNTITVSNCIDLSNAPSDFFDALVAEDMTVIRTDERIQTGWKVRTEKHDCQAGFGWAGAHATRGDRNQYEHWKFHMVRDAPEDKSEPHVCGWRTCGTGRRTFWPTRLTTEVEKEAWWAELDAQVKALASAKLKADIEATAAAAGCTADFVAAARAGAEEDAEEERDFQAAQNGDCRVPQASLIDLLIALKKHMPHHANRANRLLDNGLDKKIVRDICSHFDMACPYYNHVAYADERHALFTIEEKKLGLEPLAYPTSHEA